MRVATELLVREIRKAARTGATRDEVARRFGLGYPYVCKLGRDFGIDFTRKSGSGRPSLGVKTNRNEEICRRYVAGETQTELSKAYGLTRERVRQIIDRAGLVPERKRLSDFIAVVAGTVARKSMTVREAAAYFDTGHNNIYRYCRMHGVTPAARTQEELDELSALADEVKAGKSIRQAVKLDHAKGEKLRRFLRDNGIAAKGRSRHDDFSDRQKLIENWRNAGLSWSECTRKLVEYEHRPISETAVYAWSRRNLPHLFEQVAA